MNAAFDNYPGEDRRRSPRADGDGIRVEFHIGESDAPATVASVKNICMHGICLYLPNVAGARSLFDMKIFLPGDNAPLAAKGSVVWFNAGDRPDHFSVGIEFEHISEEDQKKIGDFVRKRLDP